MYSQRVIVPNVVGLHGKQLSLFIYTATAYQSKITLKKRDEEGIHECNAKSLLGVLSLHVVQGDIITITADGVDEWNAVNDLCQLIKESVNTDSGCMT